MSKKYSIKRGAMQDNLPTILVGDDNRPFLVHQNGDIENLQNHKVIHSCGYGKYKYCIAFGWPYHRVVALAYGLINNIEDDIEINHINNDKTDNSITNLRALSHAECIKFREEKRKVKYILVVVTEFTFGRCKYFLDDYKTSKDVVMELNDYGVKIDQSQFCRAKICCTADGKYYKHFKNNDYEVKAFLSYYRKNK